ncbi:helix-turn-helix domain-containing protein [Haloplanus salilacus]|uniref:winged helix-turn-helix domain-containing protein n=1 Tax=Haloplanus salilacus TaxID=2949994 RepID=UPI0030CFC6EF
MQIPSRTELERLFDTDLAADVQFVETVASWPSLRILEYLYANGPAATGDIARGLNMDMRDVKDRLQALEEHGVVEDDGDWAPTTDEVTITLRRDQGLEITCVTDQSPESVDERSAGVFARVRRAVRSVFA